jgi:phytoene dehydrogenase-like protein
MSKVYVVVGAGFRGYCDTLQLLQEPGAKIYLVDREPFFGGISYSGNVKGFAVDKGVHMFDGIPKELADNVAEIMGGRVRTIDFVSVSAFNGQLTDGFSLPDLSSLPGETKARITRELEVLAANAHNARPAKNLGELLEARYGKTAGTIFAGIFKRIYNIEAEKAQPDALSKTSLGRLKHLDDPDMLALKASDPFLDTVLAARRKALGKVDDFVSIYPDTGEAMRGWCVRAQKWLEDQGVTMCLGQNVQSLEMIGGKIRLKTDAHTVDADRIVWTNDNTQALAALLGFEFDTRSCVSGTPMLFATLITQACHIKDFTYLQNFDPNGKTYRTASAGIYSNQINGEGLSFVTCECPTPVDSERWNNAAEEHHAIWDECKTLGIVSPEAELVSHAVMRLPSTFKVAKIGYDAKIAEFQEEVTRRTRQVIFRDVKPFFRRDIYLDSFKVRDLVSG